jgi:hypothetical protein
MSWLKKLFGKSDPVVPGKFVSLLKVRHESKQLRATPGKMNYAVKHREPSYGSQYDVFIQDEPGWWTIAAGRILDVEFDRLNGQQTYLVGNDEVCEIGSVTTGQVFRLSTSEGYTTFVVDWTGAISRVD